MVVMFRYHRPWNVHKFLFFINFTFSSHSYHIFIHLCQNFCIFFSLLNITFPSQNYDMSHFYTIVLKMWWLCDWTKKIFFLSSHLTITFLWQLYKNVMCHNFVMEMWLLTNIGYESQYEQKVAILWWFCDRSF